MAAINSSIIFFLGFALLFAIKNAYNGNDIPFQGL